MVTYYLPVSGTTSYLVYTLTIPPNIQAINMQVQIPIGAIMAGNSSTGTITMSGIGATSATVLRDGSSYFSQSFSSANPTSKSFNITTTGQPYSAFSYFNTYTITFPLTQSPTITYTYTCYLNFQTQNQLGAGQNYPLYNCTNQTTASYVPSNYGIVINPSTSGSILTNCTYASGSSNTTGYPAISPAYNSSVVGTYFTEPVNKYGQASFDALYSAKLNTTNSIIAGGNATIGGTVNASTGIFSNITAQQSFTGLSYICVQDQTSSSNISFNTTARAVVYSTVLAYGGVFSPSSLTDGNTTITIPITGNYEIVVGGSMNYSSQSAGNNILFRIIKKTSGIDTTLNFQVQGTQPSTNNWLSTTLVVIQPLVAGDTVRLDINTATGTATSNQTKLHTMTIKRM